MLKIKYIMLFATLFLLSGCYESSDYKLLQTEKSTKDVVTVGAGSIEYRILPQDRLQILLYKNPEQSSEGGSGELGQSMNEEGMLVNASGYISLPLVGKVKVSGLTQSGAADHITKKYQRYMNTPSIYLEVLNKRLFVLGEVNKPGVVALDKEKMTLFEALAFAGDLTDAAVRDNIVIVSHNPTKGIQMRSVDLTNFDTMHYASLMLRPNDIVYVQPDGWKEFKISSDNFTAPFVTITKIAAPFVTLKYLTD